MTRFASHTEVSVERSRAEIEKLVTRYGATHTAFMSAPGRAVICFEASKRRVMFELPLPEREDKQFLRDGRGAVRSSPRRLEAWEQACRSKWRALALVIKAKLESVDSGITTFEKEFYGYIVLPTGQTIYDSTKDGVDLAYQTGQVRPLLPNYSSAAA
jgi:hypothetical protein